MLQFDILVIGGGPGGYSLAVHAAKSGFKVALFEKEQIGGTCLNVGCIPTKYLVDKALAIEKVRGLSAKEIFRDAGTFSFQKIQKGKGEVTGKLVNGVRFLLKKNGVKVINGAAELKANRVVHCNGQEYRGNYVVIATGSVPAPVKIPGYEYCLDSTGVLNLQRLPKSLVIMGGGVIGLELACAFAVYGTEITVVEMLPELLPQEQREAVQIAVREMERLGIHLRTGAKMLRVEKNASGLRAVYEVNGQENSTGCQYVLAAAGRKPNLTGIDCDQLGLAMNGPFISVDQRQRTNLDGVYAIGDVAGGWQLAHAAYAEANAALADLMGKDDPPPGERPVPVCTYTIPCFASVGLTAQAAQAKGFEPLLGSFSYEANGMALAEGASGTVFAVMDKQSKRTLGMTVVGENAPEMIAFAAAAVEEGTTLEQWEQRIVAHPSLCEMVREAALDAFGMSVHKG